MNNYILLILIFGFWFSKHYFLFKYNNFMKIIKKNTIIIIVFNMLMCCKSKPKPINYATIQ